MLDFDYLSKICIKIPNFNMQIDSQNNHVPYMLNVVYDLTNQIKQVENVKIVRICQNFSRRMANFG